MVWAKKMVLIAKYGDHGGTKTGGLGKDLSLDGNCAEIELRDSGKLVWRDSKIQTSPAPGLKRRKLGWLEKDTGTRKPCGWWSEEGRY